MIKRIFTLMVLLSAVLHTYAQQKMEAKAIENLCGCFNVTFKYAETFSPIEGYKYHDREEINGGIELALPIEISNNKVSIQHLLVISDSMIIKHWREEWTYENPILWKYIDTKTWVKQVLTPTQIKGKWTQTVWEVSDEPRYQGLGTFNIIDGETFWQNTTDAPLPRREYSVRNDYNILNRTNILHITDNGYVHKQDNKKIIRKNGKDSLLVEEKGINSYNRVAASKCSAAKKYWERNNAFWLKVTTVWNNYLNTHNTIKLKTKVEEKVLHQYLYNILQDYNTNKITSADIDNKISEAVNSLIVNQINSN
jgi:hypothetical protein